VGVINQEVNWVVQNFTFGLAPELDLGPLYGHYDSYESGKPVGDATTWAMEKAGMAAALRKQVKELFTKKIGTKVGDDAVSSNEAHNAANFEKYKDELRGSMSKPNATNGELAGYMDELYRPGATIGSGSTADAIRHELATGGEIKWVKPLFGT